MTTQVRASVMITSHDQLVSEVVDADDRRDADESDQRQEQLEPNQRRHLRAEVLVAQQLSADLHHATPSTAVQ